MTINESTHIDAFRLEVREWLADHFPSTLAESPARQVVDIFGPDNTDPDFLLWKARMGAKGWSVPMWPRSYGGGGLSAIQAKVLADEMAQIIDLSKEFGFQISSFHHGVEAYKLADVLAREKICGALWADWWGFKLEAFDGIEENIALVDRPAGGCAIVHSDSDEGIQRLNQEAAKVMASSKRANIEIPPEHAIRWVTSNAAKALRIDQQTGSLEAGKMADVVLWNGTPFSTYAKAEQVYIDGALLYERGNRALQPKADFILGQEGQP